MSADRWALLAANDGGHITQLRALADRFETTDRRMWVTVRTPQTEHLLAGETVHWTGPAPTRDAGAAWRNARTVWRLLDNWDVEAAISTGSSLAVSALLPAALRRTRADGISLSGRMLRRVPGVRLYVQWPHLANRRWRYRGSVLDGFLSEPGEPRPIARLVVSLGTSSKYEFRRLVERLAATIPPGVEVLWQTGCTDVAGLGIDGREQVPAGEMEAAIGSADAVVAHAGAGIALTILASGKVPVLVPRLASRGEHVDDHQEQIARQLARRDLAVVVDADDLDWDVVTASSGRRCSSVDAGSFALDT
jgi:UDP-N-acetylglucosamine--N-acetylmuramyl-(pentapeptide) pyrophosphoryl-undecaprenol N-acetylglucosamine transferase